MSAETLHRAASRIRTNLCHGGSGHPFYAAVADWLESTAADMAEDTVLDSPESGEYMPPNPEALWCDRCGGAIESPDYTGKDMECHCWDEALAAARAYLGESAGE